MLHIAKALNLHDLITEEGVLSGASYILRHLGKLPKGQQIVLNEQTSNAILWQYCSGLLAREKYDYVATILWGRQFQIEAESSKRIWECCEMEARAIIVGHASAGKSFTTAYYFLLDWLRDPEYTAIKVLSVTQKHAERNIFGSIKTLHSSAVIKLPGIITATSIMVGDSTEQGIHLQAIPQGDDPMKEGRLRGMHPKPRKTPHPDFGSHSRVIALIDEASQTPPGLWKDLNNFWASASAEHKGRHVKIIGVTNGCERGTPVGLRCEPDLETGGWRGVNIDTAKEWDSKMGWRVIRLDGKRCENVIQKRVIYPGLLTWDGYQNFLKMGEESADYQIQARGWFPEVSAVFSAITYDLIERSRGRFKFANRDIWCASIDPALDGGDRRCLTLGRYGDVLGYTNVKGEYIEFPNQRKGLQMEAQFDLKNTDTQKLAVEAIEILRSHGIPHHLVAVDKTGIGEGLYTLLTIMMGPNILGINFGTKATESLVMGDDSGKASELYVDIRTEMHFAFKKWLEYDLCKLGPQMADGEFVNEVTGRRHKLLTEGKAKLESKADYKARGNRSPDKADSAVMLVHLVRMQGHVDGAMKPELIKPYAAPESDPLDSIKYLRFDYND